MKNKDVSISSPDELNKHLQHTSPLTWIILSVVTALLLGFFVWSAVFKMKIKLSGEAVINNGEVTLTLDEDDLKKLSVGQSFYIANKEGTVVSFDDNDMPILSHFDLADGSYSDIAYGKRPIEFLIGK